MKIGENKINMLPRKFNDDMMNAILNDIKEGSPNKHAAEANGISERQFYNALKQGAFDIEAGEKGTIYARLVQSLRKIEQDEIKSCRYVIRVSDKGHRGAEWTLEHVYWRYFGKDAPAIEMDERLRKLENGEASHGQSSEDEGC